MAYFTDCFIRVHYDGSVSHFFSKKYKLLNTGMIGPLAPTLLVGLWSAYLSYMGLSDAAENGESILYLHNT